ncbi:MAG: hypothetical protein IJK45_07200 [Bacteroidaceae bacterium]|nr:hypothetical protein [Bacteroidaceae bacterium]
MKKYLLSLVFLSAMGTMSADPGNGGGNLPFTIKVTRPLDAGGKPAKSPILAPVVYQNGHTLLFDEALDGCVVQLLDEDENVIFTDSIEENQTDLTFPSSLSGTYELQIICGSITFYCYIEL